MKRQLEEENTTEKMRRRNDSELTLSLKSTHENVSRVVPDNWAHAFTYLDAIGDLLPNVMPVCKMFYNILGGGEGDIKSLVYERVSIGTKVGYPTSTFLKIRSFDRGYLDRLLGYIIKASPKDGCKVLHLGMNNEYNETLKFELSVDFFKRCINSGVFDGVKELRFAPSLCVFLREEEQMNVFIEWLSRLKDLEVVEYNLFPNKVLDCIFTKCPKLKKLKINLGLYELSDSFPILEHLEEFEFTSNDESFSSTTLVSLFKHAPNLRKLKMGYSMAYENAIFLGLAEHCKKLTDLTFGERYLHETDNVSIIINQLPNIENLKFTYGLPYGDNLLELDKLTKLKRFEFDIDEFSDDDGVLKDVFPKLKGLTWARYSYIKSEDGEEEEQEEEQEDEDEERGELGFVDLANKKFPNLEELYLIDSDLDGVTLTQLFEGIPHLKEIRIEVLTEGCDKVFESIEADIEVRKATSKRLLELFGESPPPTIELFEDRIFYHRIGEKKFRIKIFNIEYDNLVFFKIKLVQ